MSISTARCNARRSRRSNAPVATGALVLAACAAMLPAAGFAACDVRSGAKTAALVELYTSEGCSSCPPAEQVLGHLHQLLAPSAEAVPLALHVGYWDYLGWHDPYAQDGFAARQRRLARANRQRALYTPEFFVSGTELRRWSTTLGDAVGRVNARPAQADIILRTRGARHGVLRLDAEATTHPGTAPAVLYVAVTENGLLSKVTRGENRGATLLHDHVVRILIGPIAFAHGAARIRRQLALPRAWNRSRLELAAFVQQRDSARVLQAVQARECTGS